MIKRKGYEDFSWDEGLKILRELWTCYQRMTQLDIPFAAVIIHNCMNDTESVH